MKSAKPRSGEMPANCTLFSGFTCKRRHTKIEKIHEMNQQNQNVEIEMISFVAYSNQNQSITLPPSTKQLTVEINPDKNELNGNVPTKQQYKN